MGEKTAQGYLIAVCNCLMGGCREDRDRLFSEVHRDKSEGNRHNKKFRKFLFDIKKTFTVTVIKHCNKLPGEFVKRCKTQPELSSLL